MNLFESETIRLSLIFFVPGFISIKVYGLYIPSEQRHFSKSFFDAVSYSCINFALVYWIIIAIHQNQFYNQYPVLYYCILILILFVAPIIWPIIYSKIRDLRFFKEKTIHPIPKAWDYLFSKGGSYWIIIHTKDGRRIGGKYDTNSFVSSYPTEEQIYLEEVWHLDKKARFLKPIDRSKGIIISSREYESIELFQ